MVLATGPKHRVTFRPLLSLFSFNWEHPNSVNYPTFYSKYDSHPQNTSTSLLQEASLPMHVTAHTTPEHPFTSYSPYSSYISGLSINIASSGKPSLTCQGAPTLCAHGPIGTTNTLN